MPKEGNPDKAQLPQVDIFLRAIELEEGLSRNTIDAYRRDLYSFFLFLGEVSFKKITRRDITRYMQRVLCFKIMSRTVGFHPDRIYGINNMKPVRFCVHSNAFSNN